MGSSDWYRDPESVLEQVRLTGSSRGGIPTIAGYDGFAEIRRGGQGVVFSAIQRSTRRRVAVKLLLDGSFANDMARRRFEREVDLVAALRHPNIVQIFDSGISAEGRPYFVMEYVDGLPFDQHIANVASVATQSGGSDRFAAILKPMLAVCEAVQHAHQRGVIHRDLKPANIRVDSSGLPRVLDFGLAREFSSEGDAREASLELTQSGHFLGSFAWASPEHASGRPDAIDTRSDIYSLGLILYYLLTQHHPYPIEGSPRDILNNIVSADPDPPAKWNARIDEDLSTILMKCLAKDPARRYQGVTELEADIRHYLAGEPIQARRDSMWYTLRKRARRYQVIAVASALVILISGVGLAVSLNLWRRSERERRAADEARTTALAQRNIAEKRQRQAAAVNDVLKNILSAADPARKGKDVRVAELLERAAADAAKLESSQPEVAVPVRLAIGRSYFTLGLYPEARKQIDAGLALGTQRFGPDSDDVVEGRILSAELLLQQGKLPEAEDEAKLARQRLEALRGKDAPGTIDALHILANIVAERGRFDEAADMARTAMNERSRLLGPNDPLTIESMNLLAGCLRRMGRLNESRDLFEKTLELRRTFTGDNKSDVITTMSDLASLLSDLDQHERAIELLTEAAALADKTYGVEHPRTQIIRNNLGMALVRVKRTDEAIAQLTRILEIKRRTLEGDNPSILMSLSNLASALKAARRLDEAIPLIKEAAESAPRLLGPDHPNALIYANNYGSALMDAKRIPEAEEIFRHVVAAAEKKPGPDHQLTARFRGNLGRAVMLQDRFEEAEPHLLFAFQRQGELFGAGNERTRLAAADLAELYQRWNQPEKAAEYRQKSQAKPPDKPSASRPAPK